MNSSVKRNSTPQLVEHIKTHMDSNNQVRTTFRNKLINSNMRHQSITDRSNGIRLRNSFYNDENLEYLSRSNIMLKSSRSYQAKAISQSTRKRIDTEKVEEVMRKKKDQSFYSVRSERKMLPASKLCKLPAPNNHSLANTNKLALNHFSQTKTKKQILEKYISSKLQVSKNSEVKWFSAFKNRTQAENPFQGRPIQTVRRQDTSNDQLKVLNIDRLFRGNHRTGLHNIPLPKQVTPSKKPIPTNSLKVEQSKGATINYLIRDYNNLCKIDGFLRVRKTCVKGKTFMQQPTLEEMLGLKTKTTSRSTTTMNAAHEQLLRLTVFEEYCTYYRNNIRKDPYLRERFMGGLTLGQDGLTFQSYLHFHELFVSRAASNHLKLEFLENFFIPTGTESVSLEMFKLLMELLSERLPEASSIQIRWRDGFDLPGQEKAKIFYQTLMRVLVGEVEDRLKEVGLLNRQVLRWIFGRNEDSLDLLLLLFYDKGRLTATFSEQKPITSRV